MKTEITINIMAHNRTLSLWLKDTINMKRQLSQSKKGGNDSHKTVRKEADGCLQLAENVLPLSFGWETYLLRRETV